ncbi:hypothetical protein GF326_08035 [Candidatus Bathyarchaeota archaeon]|nr:hypothetical protein [Candidatus Bathyarchaeota archaeon]
MFVRTVLNEDRVSGSTINEVKKKWREIEKIYRDTETHKEKIITYNYQANAFVMDEKGNNCLFRRDDMYFQKGSYGIVLTYQVLYRHVRQDINRVTYHREDGSYVSNQTLTKEPNYLPWTPEAEAFFKQALKQINLLAMKVGTFLDQEPDQLEQKIRESSGLLELKQAEVDSD